MTVVATSLHLKNVEKIFTFLRRDITITDIVRYYKSFFKTDVGITKYQAQECVTWLEKQGKVKHFAGSWSYVRKQNILFMCIPCKFTAFSRAGIYAHFEKQHIKQFKVGEKIKNCKIGVKEIS